MRKHFVDYPRIKKICNHEVGHYIIARELSYITSGINIIVYHPKGHSAGSGLEPWTPNIIDIIGLKLNLERRVKVLYAGAIAEAMSKDSYNAKYAVNEFRTGGSKDDYAKMREIIQILRNIRFPDTNRSVEIQGQLDLIDNELIQETGKMVTERFDLILEVGTVLFNKVIDYAVEYKLDEDEINQIPGIRNHYKI